MIQTIDTRGHLCPTPLIMAKKAIAAAQAGEELLILSDNTTSCQNLMQYLTDLGAMPCQTNQGIETNGLLHHFSGHITLTSAQILRDHHTRTNADEIKQRNTDVKDLVAHRQCGNGLIRNMADHERIQRRSQKMQRQIDE